MCAAAERLPARVGPGWAPRAGGARTVAEDTWQRLIRWGRRLDMSGHRADMSGGARRERARVGLRDLDGEGIFIDSGS